MAEMINGKTPEEIKAALDYCSHDTCGDNDECAYLDEEIRCWEKVMKDALEYIQHLEAAQPKWISVKERLPESGVHVFVLCEIRANGSVIRRYVCDGFHVEAWKEKAGCYSEDCALAYNDEDDEYYLEEGWYEVIKNWEEYNSVTIDDFVTHWMPLPNPPKENVHD